MDLTADSPSSNTVKLSLPWKWRPVKRQMAPGSELFADGDTALHSARKFVPLEREDSSDDDCNEKHTGKETISCGVIGCQQTFSSLLSYENHYHSAHRHVCITCHRTLPSAHLLDVHITENHDPLFSILAAKQSMYQCLVEGCQEKFLTADNRRQHLIKTHKYPSNFRFHRIQPNKGKSSKSKPKPKAETTQDEMEIDSSTCGDKKYMKKANKDDHTAAISSNHTSGDFSQPESTSDKENRNSEAVVPEPNSRMDEDGSRMDVCDAEKPSGPRRVFVHKVPQNFTFGHGVGRGFRRPPGKRGKGRGGHWHQRAADDTRDTTTHIENVNMKDMAEALSDAV